MSLKIKDVASLLNVSEAVIQRWISEKKIPFYKMGQQYCFDRSEIEAWLISQKTLANKREIQENTVDNVDSPQGGGSKQFSLFRAIHKGLVLHEVPGQTKEDIIRTSTKTLSHHLNLDAEVLTELLLDREKLMPTAVDNGIGIPHARDFLLKNHNDIVTIVFPEHPIAYGALDGKPVHTLFFLLASEDKKHLHLLSKIAHFAHQKQNIDFLQTKPSKEKLLDYVKAWEGKIQQVMNDE